MRILVKVPNSKEHKLITLRKCRIGDVQRVPNSNFCKLSRLDFGVKPIDKIISRFLHIYSALLKIVTWKQYYLEGFKKTRTHTVFYIFSNKKVIRNSQNKFFFSKKLSIPRSGEIRHDLYCQTILRDFTRFCLCHVVSHISQKCFKFGHPLDTTQKRCNQTIDSTYTYKIK